RVDSPPPVPGGPRPLHNGVQVFTEGIPCDLTIFTPDGQPFTNAEVTLEDLQRYRDLRGTPQGQWKYSLSGRSRNYTLTPVLHEAVYDPRGSIQLTVVETVHSASAPMLIDAPLDSRQQTFQFDLFRVGTFVAELRQTTLFGVWDGSMVLRDPDGVQVAGPSKTLRFEVGLRTLAKSRDAEGRPRMWTLEVSSHGGLT